MGITNFTDFVERIQPDAIVTAKKKERGTNNAFTRAGGALQAVILDAMTHKYSLTASLGWKNEQPDKYRVTGDDLLIAFWRRVADYFESYERALSNGAHEEWEDQETETKRPPLPRLAPEMIVLFDKSEYVNPAKGACQKKRSASRGIEGYGPQVQYYKEGVRPEPSAVMQSIDINKALSSRGAASKALTNFLIAGLTVKPQVLKWPRSTHIYIDSSAGIQCLLATEAGELYEYAPGGVVPDTKTEDGKEEVPQPRLNLQKARNKLGEADIAAVRWTILLKRPVRLVTSDSDWPMLHIYHVWPRVNKFPEVIWDTNSCRDSRNIHGFCVHRAITDLRDTHHFTREAIVALAVLSGCDYVEKSAATKGVGHNKIYEGFFAYMRATRTATPRPNLGKLDDMTELLNAIYRAAGKAGVPMGVDALSDLYVSYKLTMDYFCSFICSDPTTDPAKPGQRLCALKRVAHMQAQVKHV